MFQKSRIDHIDIAGVLAKICRRLRVLLKSEMGDLKKRVLGKLLENSIGDLGISCKLLCMGADDART